MQGNWNDVLACILWGIAEESNRLAKIPQGRGCPSYKERMYELKNRALSEMIEYGSVCIGAPDYKCRKDPELLSVQNIKINRGLHVKANDLTLAALRRLEDQVRNHLKIGCSVDSRRIKQQR